MNQDSDKNIGVEIRKASVGDLMCIHEMAEVVFRHTYRDILSPEQMEYMMDWMYSPSGLQKQVDDGHVYYIALRDAIPCGYVSVQPDGLAESGRLLFHLQKIYVLPSEQGRGVGRMLFDRALSHIRSAASGHPAMLELNVNRNNPSIGFYQRLGLSILRQGDFHIGNGFYMNDYIMGCEVD